MVVCQVFAGLGTLYWLGWFCAAKKSWQTAHRKNQENPKGSIRKNQMQNIRRNIGLLITLSLIFTAAICATMGSIALSTIGRWNDSNYSYTNTTESPDCQFCLAVSLSICSFFVCVFFCIVRSFLQATILLCFYWFLFIFFVFAFFQKKKKQTFQSTPLINCTHGRFVVFDKKHRHFFFFCSK